MSENRVLPTLGIGTLQWNASHHTISLLKDLFDTPCIIAVCDNGSASQHGEAVLKYLQSTTQEVSDHHCSDWQWLRIYIENKRNSGFAAGMNLCIESLLAQQADWIWLLNNDTNVDSESITILCGLIDDLPPGVYGTKMQDQKSGKVSYGNRFGRWTSRYSPIDVFSGDYEMLGDWYPDGASMLIHREVLEKVGFLSEDYFIYFEELDFKRRIAEYGYQLKILPDVIVKHAQAGSSLQSTFSASRMYHETYSTLTFYKKHHAYYIPVILLLRTPMRLLSLLVKGRYSEIKPAIKATLDFLMSNRAEFTATDVSGRRYFCSDHAK